ncbi:MAG: hypothetical protein KF723_07495 [Rhizobiaceae bacterium]|nr:hypothetical protein [Rhizobiaceae bacterium]
MDWSDAVERNRVALKRLLASLLAMAQLAFPQARAASADDPRPETSPDSPHPEVRPEGATGSRPETIPDGPHPEVRAEGEPRRTLPRHLHRAILRQLRPAEAAARRLVIVVARGMAAPPPRRALPDTSIAAAAPLSPSPLRGGGEGAFGTEPGPCLRRTLALPLLDPLPRPVQHRRVPTTALPRISLPGITRPFPVPLRRPLSPDDPVDAARLALRLEALRDALDDMPRHARRFLRWQAARMAGGAHGGNTIRRLSPLKPGRPPGGRLARYDPAAPRPRTVREVDGILAHAHALALFALERPDTS